MKIKLLNSFKSIKSLPSVELPKFTVLTGINGSGKTHFLQAIQNGNIQIDTIPLTNKKQNIRLFDWNSLIPNDDGSIDPNDLVRDRNKIWSRFSSVINKSLLQLSKSLEQIGLPDDVNKDLRKLSKMTFEDISKFYGEPNQAKTIFDRVTKAFIQSSSTIEADLESINIISDLHNRIKNLYDYPIVTLEQEDLMNNYPVFSSTEDPFKQSFARLFSAYEKARVDNEFRELRYNKGQNVSFLSEEEFVARNGKPPWDFVNDILQRSNLGFSVDKPNGYENLPYKCNLISHLNGDEINFTDLSSGERILMSFALCVYYAEDGRNITKYPELLLLDEVDAPLHPSMTLSLLNTIQDILVKKHNINVILSTHSPSTVALSPEGSIYMMKHDGQSKVEKVTKDHALEMLTTGVPSLSINYENRRQVFVESKYDAEFYEKIYHKLRGLLVPEISLNFISSGPNGQGNCDQVKDIVNKLRRCGNPYIYGIVDWDLKNQGNTHVKVLGKDSRHSIENYIFDPILVSIFLIREKYIDRKVIEMKEDELYSSFNNFDSLRLQKIVDYIVGCVKGHIQDTVAEESILCKYVGNKEVDIPTSARVKGVVT